jgi:predicted flavoprotein YhiN
MSNHLRRVTGLTGVKAGLLREICAAEIFADPQKLAESIKALPLQLSATRPLAEAISSAGGLAFDGVDENYMLRTREGVFCAGEMLDWEAPTGGYLLTACFATGRAAGEGAARWLAQRQER